MVRLFVVVMLVLSGGCGRVFFEESAGATHSDAAPTNKGPTPIHRYRLVDSFADEVGGQDLVGLGGLFKADLGYKFAANQGLKLVGGMPVGAYTVDIRFVFNEIGACNPGGDHYCKLLDFKDLSQDEGLYTLDEKLQFVILANAGPVFVESTAVFSSGVEATVTLTRDTDGTTVAYVNRNRKFSFVDTTGMARFTRPGQVAYFAIDDQETSQREASSGSIREIAIWDVALTQAEIAAL
jgi:hypothetical protein